MLTMVGRNAYELDVDDIVQAAIEVFDEHGLDAVSMRSVSARLGVSPVPLYRRVGNKEDLVSAMSLRLFGDVAPEPEPGESWSSYAMRWAEALRTGHQRVSDGRLTLRASYVKASRPLIEAMRAEGFAVDAAVQACRILVWATIGFVAIEAARPRAKGKPTRQRRAGSDPVEVTSAEADELFALQIRFLVEGIEREIFGEAP